MSSLATNDVSICLSDLLDAQKQVGRSVSRFTLASMTLDKSTHCATSQPNLVTFLADRTSGRAIATLLRLSSVCLSVVCDVMYCG